MPAAAPAAPPTFFATAAEFRRWLEKHHAKATELHVGFYKKSAGKPGMTYKESVDEALCFGWIDGVVRKLDEERFTHRFTPRRPGSIWSNVNVGHVARLTTAGRMHAAGLAAFAARRADRTGIYAFEAKQPAPLSPALARQIRANPAAWKFFSAQAPWYQRKVAFWLARAKQPATQARRLARLIAEAEAGRQV